jgi:GNAT superfamily N-acetyltransferase
MPDNINYTIATIADIPTLIALRIEFLTELSGEQSTAVLMALADQLTNYFYKALPDETCYCVLAKCGDEVAATGIIVIRNEIGNFKTNGNRTGYIRNMYTKPAYRKRGIGKDVLERLVEIGRQSALGKIELRATDEGRNLYLNQGFVPPKSDVLELTVS